jgi:hypothetical protein
VVDRATLLNQQVSISKNAPVLSANEDETRSECPIFHQQYLAVGQRFLSHFDGLTSALGGSCRGLRLFFSTGDGLLKLGAELRHLALNGGQQLLSNAQLLFNRSGPRSLFNQLRPRPQWWQIKSDFARLHARSTCAKESHKKHTIHVGQKQKSKKAPPTNLT